jgi:hypothetical protein
MTGEDAVTSRLNCDYCGFHSCGACLLAHLRKAHPSDYMREMVPVMRSAHLARRRSGIIKASDLTPRPDNVVRLNFHGNPRRKSDGPS